MSVSDKLQMRTTPEPAAVLTLLKPITWFPPMWAYLCGAVSSGVSPSGQWLYVLIGVIPGRWGFYIALIMSALSLAVGALLGPWGFAATVVAVLAAWAYSAEPVRMKRSGWWGPGLVGLSYESLPWFTGAAVLAAGAPRLEIVIIALLYGIGAHGIMTLNDFKALEGDRQMGVNSLPVTLGPRRAAQVACVVMAVPQVIVMALLLEWDRPLHAAGIGALLAVQFWAMSVLFKDPKGRAPWYNGTGVMAYVSGMMIAAFALRGLI